MNFRRFIMEDWLASYKDSCPYNLGESGMPNITVGELLAQCGESPDSLRGIILKDNDTRGTERLRAAVAATYHGGVSADTVTVTTGTSEALFILFDLCLEKRTSVVVPFPSFQALYEVPRALGAQVRFYPLEHENGYIPDPDMVVHLIDDSTGAVVINSPHNPSGALMPADSAEMIIRKAEEHGALVIADEHYRYLPIDDDRPLPSLADPGGCVVATGSITKCFGVIGLRMGWIVAPEELISRVRDFRDYLTHSLSPVSDYLGALMLEHAQLFLTEAVSRLRLNRSHLEKVISGIPGLSCILPRGGVVAFPRYRWSLPSETFARGLIDQYGVFVLPGSSFEVENHFRINLGLQPHSFREALALISAYCRSLEETC